MGTLFTTNENLKKSRGWVEIDAEDQVVGRLATRIASILRGKTKTNFAPHQDGGDFVVVVNAEKIKFTGEKLEKKVYHRYTGFVGNMKTETAGKLLQRKPEQVLLSAVKGMLPKTPLGRAQLKKLKVYSGATHTHKAQKPKRLEK